jgi:uncharacterized protein (UPF0303 family)
LIHTVGTLLDETARLVLRRCDFDTCWKIGSRLRSIAAADNLPIAIQVTHTAIPVFLSVMPGATADNVHWLHRKCATVQRFQKSSLYMRLKCEEMGIDFNTRYGLSAADFVASGGAVPLMVRGAGMVGVAAVSGLPDSEDHALVVRSLEELGLIAGL